MKMAMKSKLSLVFLLFSLFVLLASLSLVVAKQDPELTQCKYQCRQQEQFDEQQKEQCEHRCEDYHKEKQRREREKGGSGDDWNVVVERKARDPEKQYRECREQCRRQGPGQQSQCEKRCEKEYREQQGGGEGNTREESRREGEEEEQENNPYVFEDQHFTTRVKTQEGRVRVLQSFSERSKHLRGLKNYRVAILEANPRTFTAPNHWDAEVLLFVVKGRAIISLIHEGKRESFNLRCGDIIRVPAGTPVYMINRDDNEKLYIAKLLQPVSTPGHFQAFFGAGGEDPESFYSAFSIELLEAALKTGREKLKRVFGQQKQGIIIKASKEQIEAMSRHEEGGGMWPFGGGGESSRGPFNLLNRRPSQSNNYGRLYQVDSNDYKQLQDLDVAVAFANITKGSMEGPFYNSKATKISIVVEGEGYFEMACPHLSSSEAGGQHHGGGGSQQHQSSPHYQKVRAQLRRGVVFIVPAGHPVITVASNNQNLQIVCFEVNAQNNEKFALAGKRNIISQLEKEAKELAFNVPAREVQQIFQNNEEELFFPGPRQQKEGRAYA